MTSLSRSQLLVYGAVAVTILLVGMRWVRSEAGEGAAAGPVRYGEAADDREQGAGSFALDEAGGEDVVVHVAGAVREPGVYRLPADSRVTDAVERAGGPAAAADLEGLNLAARLADGQQVVVPARITAGGAAAPPPATGAPADAPISLGSATLEELDTIEGIGPVTAQAILDYRAEHGGVASIDELDAIDGIGPATMDALRGRLQP